MKKTSLRKNRFSDRSKRLLDNVQKRKLSNKNLLDSQANPSGMSLRDMMMHQWEFNDAHIAELLAETVGKPISPEAQAFIDHIDALMDGRASIGDLLRPVTSEAA